MRCPYKVKDQHRIAGEGETYDDVCEAIKELFDLFMGPNNVPYKKRPKNQRAITITHHLI